MSASYSNKTVLITGASGFLGGHLAEELLQRGARVIGLDHKAKEHSYLAYENLDSEITLCQGDITKLDSLLSIIREYRIEYIFHCAGRAILSDCSKHPVECFDANVMGTVNILDCARQCDHVKGIACMESYKLYGSLLKEDLPYNENQTIRPSNIYEVSKAASNYILKGYQQNYNIPVLAIRLANLYGPGDFNVRIVPQSILKVLDNQPPEIYEEVQDYVREFLYVKDAASAICDLLTHVDTLSGETINLGSGSTYKIRDVITTILGILESNMEPKVIKKSLAYTEIDEQYLDIRKLKSLLPGFEPKRIEAGLAETIKWYVQNYEQIKSSQTG